MATGKLTKRTVDAQRSGDKDTYLWDAGHSDALSGFGLKVTPAGRKVYLIQYRPGGRKGRSHPACQSHGNGDALRVVLHDSSPPLN